MGHPDSLAENGRTPRGMCHVTFGMTSFPLCSVAMPFKRECGASVCSASRVQWSIWLWQGCYINLRYEIFQ